MNTSIRTRVFSGTALALAVSAVLTACGGGEGASSDTKAAKATPGTTPAERRQGPAGRHLRRGLYILDGESLALTRTIELPGFNRVSPAGDDDHVIVSTDTGFRVLDATGQTLTGITYEGAKPGHVVRHA